MGILAMAATVSSKDARAMCSDSNIITGIGHQHNHMSVLVFLIFLILVLYGLLFLFLLFLFCIGPLGPDEGHCRWQGIRRRMLPICGDDLLLSFLDLCFVLPFCPT